ncbi:hypothetical protein [Streptomyces zagrosensis]|uniref:Uncharacterized protein n=1 Tax=Streptomyces zagrosensis TaxID=1042984 RepID=A0A7W9V0H9_9ACTN|nr:hypothetical protein [Streptomyces zagrosensis]MBB5937877.1 hypothetical protein [Streptomyces zagrosensis]
MAASIPTIHPADVSRTRSARSPQPGVRAVPGNRRPRGAALARYQVPPPHRDYLSANAV